MYCELPPLEDHDMFAGSQSWMAIKTGFISSHAEIIALDGYILSFQRIWNYFVAEILIVLRVGTWPNTKVRQYLLWENS